MRLPPELHPTQFAQGNRDRRPVCVYGYDANGNLNSNLSWNNAFDAQNRLVSATSSLPPSFHIGPIYISYDARNRPVKRIYGSTTTYLVYDGWNLVAEFDSSGNQIAKYVHGASTDEVLERIGSPANVYYHHDALGSVAKLTNNNGSVVEQYSYSVFGSPTIKNGSGSPISASAYSNRFMFTGREYFAWQGMYDYRNRIYVAGLGRFMQTDPIRFEGDATNLYRYVGNRVTEKTDPLGLASCCKGVYTPDYSGEFPTTKDNSYADCVAQANARKEWESNQECYGCDDLDRIVPRESCLQRKQSDLESRISICEIFWLGH